MDTDPLGRSLILLLDSGRQAIWLSASLWIGIVILLVLSAVSSTAFASFLAIDPREISPFEEKGESPSIGKLRKLLRKPAHTMLSLAANTVIFLCLGVLLTYLSLADIVRNWQIDSMLWRSVAIAAAFLIATFIFLFLGCLLPILLFSGTEFLVKNASLIRLVNRLTLVLLALPIRLANLFADISRLPEKFGVSDFGVYEKTAEEEEELEPKEREMISAIVEMGETVVREIMTPRVDIVAIDADEPLDAILKQVAEAPFSRFPVFEDSIDNIIGILHIRHLMRTIALGGEGWGIRDILSPATFVPESKRIDELLQDLQRDKTHIAIVTDEYGGVAGLVTIEDILEEIVGEIHDEYDTSQQELVQVTEDGSYIVNAMLPLSEFNERTGLNVNPEEYDTVGGLLYANFGRIPKKGDELYIDRVKFTVLHVERNRIKLVQVQRLEEEK